MCPLPRASLVLGLGHCVQLRRVWVPPKYCRQLQFCDDILRVEGHLSPSLGGFSVLYFFFLLYKEAIILFTERPAQESVFSEKGPFHSLVLYFF